MTGICPRCSWGGEPAVKINGLRPWDSLVHDAKRAILEHFLRNAGGSVTGAARALGMERAYVSRLIRQLGVRKQPDGR